MESRAYIINPESLGEFMSADYFHPKFQPLTTTLAILKERVSPKPAPHRGEVDRA